MDKMKASKKNYKQTRAGIFNYGPQILYTNRRLKAILENPRFQSYACAGVLLFLSLFLGLSIWESLFGGPGKNAAAGDFFADSYGILSFIIPVYLSYAAFILIDKKYNPARIFFLYCAIFPFMTLSIGFSFLRGYAYFSSNIKLLLIMGKNGFSFAIVFLTAVEAAVILALSSMLFPAPPLRRPRAARTVNRGGSPSNPEIRLLCPPANKPMNIVREAYTTAFEELQMLENENNEAIDAAIENLKPNLEILNAKLENLDADINRIDAAFNKLDTNLDALKSELTLSIKNDNQYVDAGGIDDVDMIIETPDSFRESVPVTGVYNEENESVEPEEPEEFVEELDELEELTVTEYNKGGDVEKISGSPEAEAA
ncbi:MAG: hypothetical protein LBP37_02245, partial [Spirochaetaceae bacterium]|nr:hypothetical protein [Spirochaetaceae bacterium]